MYRDREFSRLFHCLRNRIQSFGEENDEQYLRTNVIDVFGKETEPICDYIYDIIISFQSMALEYVNVNVNPVSFS